jgi:hypothetical protein
MPDNVSFRVEGAQELRRALVAAGNDLSDLKDANQDASRIVLNAAQTGAPHLTGRLAASGHIEVAADRANVIFGSAKVPYANAVHWGWSAHHMKAQPFAVAAAERTRPQWVQAYTLAVEKIVRQLEAS